MIHVAVLSTDPRLEEALRAAGVKSVRVDRDGAKLPPGFHPAALIVENQIHLGMDGLIVVAVDEETQLERLVRRDELPRDEAMARIRSQAPLADKLAAADWVIDTHASLAAVQRRVAQVWEEIRAGGPRFK